MTTSDLVRGTIIPCLIGLIVLSALNFGGVVAIVVMTTKKPPIPVTNMELKIVMPGKDEEPVSVSVESTGKSGSAEVNGKKIW